MRDGERRRGGEGRARSVGIALSIAAHVVVLGVLALAVRAPPEAATPRASDVRFIRLPTLHTLRSGEGRAFAIPDATRKARTTADVRRSGGAIEAVAAPPMRSSPEAALPIDPGGPKMALRGLLACGHADFLHLSTEERRRCDERLLAQGRDGPDLGEAGVDPRKRAVFDAGTARDNWVHTPFLSAMPKKGCRPRVTEHDAAAFGKSQPDFTAQVTCVVGF